MPFTMRSERQVVGMNKNIEIATMNFKFFLIGFMVLLVLIVLVVIINQMKLRKMEEEFYKNMMHELREKKTNYENENE